MAKPQRRVVMDKLSSSESLLKLQRCSKLLLSSYVSCVSHYPYLFLGARHISGFVYLIVAIIKELHSR